MSVEGNQYQYDRGRRKDHGSVLGDPMKHVSDLTFMVGPPGPEDLKRNVEGWAKNAGKPTSELWVEYVHDALGQLAQRKSDQESSNLDEILSRVLGVPVVVDDPFMTSSFQGGAPCPGMMIYMDKVRSADGRRLAVDWADPAIRESIGAVLGMVLKSEWVRSLVAYS